MDAVELTSSREMQAHYMTVFIINYLACLMTLCVSGTRYKGRLSSTIGNERLNNSRLGQNRSREDFIILMNNLNLPYPKQIDKALPANQACGSISIIRWQYGN